jgi:hypothetical protein
MKFSLVATLAVLGSASAFAPPAAGGRARLVSRSVLSEPTIETTDAVKGPEAKDATTKSEPLLGQKPGPVDATGMPELNLEQDNSDKIEP